MNRDEWCGEGFIKACTTFPLMRSVNRKLFWDAMTTSIIPYTIRTHDPHYYYYFIIIVSVVVVDDNAYACIDCKRMLLILSKIRIFNGRLSLLGNGTENLFTTTINDLFIVSHETCAL